MAMDVGGAKGGVKSDINVTPLVDVMLVLLIIMMIIAPLLQQGVVLTLPKAANTTRQAGHAGSDHRLRGRAAASSYVNTLEVPEGRLIPRLQNVFEKQRPTPSISRATRTRRTAPS